MREHLQERVGVPGFRFGRRYELASSGDRQFFAFYEVDSPDVLASPAYLERLENADALDDGDHADAFPQLTLRTVCDLRFAAGDLIGSHAVVLRADGAMAPTAEAGELVRKMADEPGIARVQLWTASAKQTPSDTAEMKRRAKDQLVAGAFVVECVRREDAERIAGQLAGGAAGGARRYGPQRGRRLRAALRLPEAWVTNPVLSLHALHLFRGSKDGREGGLRVLLRERQGFELVAVGVEDEGAEVGRHRGLAGAGRAGACPACGQRRRVEGAHRRLACGAQGDMPARIGCRGRHVGARIQPQLGILLAEADAAGARHEPGVSQGGEQALVERAGGGEVAHGNRDVIDHVSPDDEMVSDPLGLTP